MHTINITLSLLTSRL